MDNKDSVYCSCLYFSANALARSLTRMADEAFSLTGLAPSYAFLLMSVNRKPGIQPSELAQHMQLSPSTITRLIEKMESRGFVQRKSVGRTTEVYPTSQSTELDPKIKEAWQGLYRKYSDLLGEDFAKQLNASAYQAYLKLES